MAAGIGMLAPVTSITQWRCKMTLGVILLGLLFAMSLVCAACCMVVCIASSRYNHKLEKGADAAIPRHKHPARLQLHLPRSRT